MLIETQNKNFDFFNISNDMKNINQYSRRRLIKSHRDCLKVLLLSGVFIKQSCAKHDSVSNDSYSYRPTTDHVFENTINR